VSAVHIRRIRPDEGRLLRDLRLRSLADAPEAFGQTVAEAATRPAEDWSQQARAASEGGRRAWFLAEDDIDGRVVGLVQGRRRPPEDVLIFSMWVDPGARMSGAGRALLGTLGEWARGWGARRAVLWVFSVNEGAIRFYERLGFRRVESGPDAESGASWGTFAMELDLSA
jgi:GNAT superfamily N-acetyltransferase